VKEIFAYAVEKENEFKSKTPDYDEASKFLIQSRNEELAELGYEPDQVKQMIDVERLTIAAQAKAQGKNPAELVYNIAKRRGFTAKAPDGEKAATEGAPPVTSEQKIDAAKKGAEYATSLSNGRGNLPPGLTVQRLLEMSEADFDRAMQTPEGRALMGS